MNVVENAQNIRRQELILVINLVILELILKFACLEDHL